MVTMSTSPPHFLLFSEVDGSRPVGRWHFSIESMQGRTLVEASDEEPGVHGERLELLAVIRGLEALEQPSRVTLLTPSRYVSRGLRFGLEEWRSNGWRWERDGRPEPIKNRDLWQRVDWAMKFHQVKCRSWRIDAAGCFASDEPATVKPRPLPRRSPLGQRLATAVRRWWAAPIPWPVIGAAGPTAT